MKYGNDYENIPKLNAKNVNPMSLRPDVYVYSDGIVNLVFIGKLGADGYIIVDTGMPTQAQDSIQTARDLYGQTSKPKQIILTHGDEVYGNHTFNHFTYNNIICCFIFIYY